MLQAGVGSMLVRYPIAIAVAYGTFLLGVWLWLQYAGVGDAQERRPGDSLVDGAGLPDIPIGGSRGGGGSGGGFSGKGGGFDGGGASGSWVEGGPRGAMSSPQLNAEALASASGSDASSSGGSGSGFDLDLGDDLGMVILGLLLVLAVLAASGYLVWAAPDILTEAAFGAMLAGGLARRSKHEDAAGWVAGVMKKTWWPFAIVLALALGFAGYAAKHHPQAETFRQALEAAATPSP
jgi:hypothetical protein